MFVKLRQISADSIFFNRGWRMQHTTDNITSKSIESTWTILHILTIRTLISRTAPIIWKAHPNNSNTTINFKQSFPSHFYLYDIDASHSGFCSLAFFYMPRICFCFFNNLKLETHTFPFSLFLGSLLYLAMEMSCSERKGNLWASQLKLHMHQGILLNQR